MDEHNRIQMGVADPDCDDGENNIGESSLALRLPWHWDDLGMTTVTTDSETCSQAVFFNEKYFARLFLHTEWMVVYNDNMQMHVYWDFKEKF